MANNTKNFLVSTADFALYYDDILACTGTTNLNSSIEVSMQEQNVNAGKGNQLIYSYKYGRELNVSLEAADWKLEYIAAQTGSQIVEGLNDLYKIRECVQLTNGVGVLKSMPIGDVAIELGNGSIITVEPEGMTVDLTVYGLINESVNATYQFNRIAKKVTIDAESSPKVYKLVLDADKHNNKIGKVGSVQIVVPSYQPSGNFTMSFTPDGISSTTIDGKALAVEGERCADGSAVYANVFEFDETEKAMEVVEIAGTPAVIDFNAKDEVQKLSVVGLKGALYAPIEIENELCTFESRGEHIATVDVDGTVTAVGDGNTTILISYNGIEDEVEVVVANAGVAVATMGKEILTVPTQETQLLGKAVSELVTPDTYVLSDGSVIGTLKKVTGYTDFSSKASEQKGHYFPVKLTQTGTTMTIKKNGVAATNKTDIPFDPDLVLRVENDSVTFSIEVDGSEVATFDFSQTIFE